LADFCSLLQVTEARVAWNAGRPPDFGMRRNHIFQSFFCAGFECASHRRSDGRRLDLLKSTGHDRCAREDFSQLQRFGIKTIRDGLRWHRIERLPRYYDWSSFLPMLKAAEASDTTVIWDLCHYGWPDHLDIWSSDFVERFRDFSAAVAQLVKNETGRSGIYCPINEISFWAWAGGDMAKINPHARGRGYELKLQLARAAIASIDAIRGIDGNARFITAEPLINVVSGRNEPGALKEAEEYRLFQYQATDMITGAIESNLGGRPEYLDVLGLNYYPDNQWYFGGATIPLGHHSYRPLSGMLREAHERYQRPLLISETGAEGSAAAAWLHYVCDEVQEAMGLDVPVEGICLYPILDYPGWENERMCRVGLLGEVMEDGSRPVNRRLLTEIERQRHLFAANAASGIMADA
jgi:hypothetical protein